MIYFFLFAAALFLHTAHGNVKDNECDQNFVPMYLPDSQLGSYCRYSPAYSQIDFVFLIDVSNGTINATLEAVSELLYNSLISDDAKFSNSSLTNDVAFVAVADKPYPMVRFGSLNSAEEVKAQFKKLINWRNRINKYDLNFTAGLQYIDEHVIDYNNDRSKMVIVIGNHNNPILNNDPYYANVMKSKGVNIFSIGYTDDLYFFNMDGTYFSKISTAGWFSNLISDSSLAMNSSYLFQKFNNFARQAGCRCPSGTTQFSAMVSTSNPDGNERNATILVKEIYADCIFKPSTDEKTKFDVGLLLCREDIEFNSRLIAFNTSAKWNFTKEYLGSDPNYFWSGKRGDFWLNYYPESELPVDYIPSSYNDPTLQGICRNTFNITSGTGAAIGSRFLCEASPDMLFLPLCEARAFDSANNPRLCSCVSCKKFV